MIVERIMMRDVARCAPNETLEAAVRQMCDRDVGFIAITERDDRVVGVVTDRDACMAAYAKRAPLSTIRVSDVMSRHVRACRPDDELATVEETMSLFKIRRMPVVDGGRLIGILSLDDIAMAAERGQGKHGFPSASEVCHTLASICAPASTDEEEESA
jgi:CBS domain-containing protein